MKVDKASIKTWSTIGSRATFGMAALELGATIEDLMILSADTSTSAGLDRFRKTYPAKFLDCGISEQNMIGIAAGLAGEGLQVFTTTFAPFQTLRCCEQIKVNLGYMEHKVTMVGLASGIALGMLGYTHCAIEDMAIMRAIPNIDVVSPADCTETFKAVLAAVKHKRSLYIRLTGTAKNPAVYEDDYDFEIGRAITLREGSDVTLIATGTMVHESLKAAVELEAQGVSCAVINMHTIKPIDQAAIKYACKNSDLVVTVEEHSIIGGLGSAVAEYKSTLGTSVPQMMIGLPNAFGKGGEYPHLLQQYGLTGEQIAAKVKNALEGSKELSEIGAETALTQ